VSDATELSSGSGSRYRFLSRIATGGMAELYLGEATGIGGVTKRVALKRILPGHANDREYLEMFLEEARLASTLQHPNIVQTHDVIRSGDDYVMVMEYLEGSDLYQFRRRLRTTGQTMPLQHVLYVVLSVLSGLHYAHDRMRPDGKVLGIVHRDVSPQNIFLTYDGNVKLLDFGIAKADVSTAVTRTESGVLKGKVLYMSPEQCSGRDVDRRADVYAVGVVLYQLLTWSMPHRGKNAYDTMRSIIDDPVPRPSLLNPAIPPVLEQIVLTSLAKNPADRYSTARDMQIDLERYATENGMYTSSVGFSTFVESVLGGRPAPSQPPPMVPSTGRSLPKDISVSMTQGSDPAAARAQSPEQVLYESGQVVLRRVAGIQVLVLTGVIDERFDASRASPLLKGEVVVDTHEVTRITSFGIRQLISVFKEAKPRITGLYHVRCSVAVISQVTMIRSLLGGGRILSFAAPYLDSVTNASFTVVLRGEEAATAIRTHEPPKVPSPSDPQKPAEFDEDPDIYFNFAEDFLAEAPPHLGAPLRLLEERERRLELELTVGEEGSTLHIRRPLREDDRWQRVLHGLEGAVIFDLCEVTTADDRGVRSFVRALEEVADEIRSIRIVGAPLSVCTGIGNSRVLAEITTIESVQVFGRCTSCETERRMILTPTEAHAAALSRSSHTCTRCGGNIAVTSEIAEIGPIGTAPTLAQGARKPSRATKTPAPQPAWEQPTEHVAPRPGAVSAGLAAGPGPAAQGGLQEVTEALPLRLRAQIGCLLALGVAFALSAAGAAAGLFLRVVLAGG
jgi:serine/threonine protein kinase